MNDLTQTVNNLTQTVNNLTQNSEMMTRKCLTFQTSVKTDRTVQSQSVTSTEESLNEKPIDPSKLLHNRNYLNQNEKYT